MNTQELLREMSGEAPVILYGARMLALDLYEALKQYPGVHVDYFAVTSTQGNPREIDGKPVVCIDKLACLRESAFVLIAAHEGYHADILKKLHGLGFAHVVPAGSQMENTIMTEYYRRLGRFPLLCGVPPARGAQDPPQVRAFAAVSVFDKARAQHTGWPPWVTPLQVGASATEKRLCAAADNTGGNISFKNRNYCELTASYWIWKNVKAEYKGLFHYRRMMDLDRDLLARLRQADVDALLPLPSVHYPNSLSHHRDYTSEEDWQAMIRAVREISPEYLPAFDKVFGDRYFYNYNILIAKQAVFDAYCAWLFRVLERAEGLCGGAARADRFAGYLGENLTTLYFMRHQESLNIYHHGIKWVL